MIMFEFSLEEIIVAIEIDLFAPVSSNFLSLCYAASYFAYKHEQHRSSHHICF